MKFESYINENNTEIITKECSEYIKALSHCLIGKLYRGVGDKVKTFIKKTPRINRIPVDTKQYTQDRFDKLFQKKFGWKVRSEGVMVTSRVIIAASYAARSGGGSTCIFYPTNGYKYVWSPKVSDFFLLVRNMWPWEGRNEKTIPGLVDRFRLEMNTVLTVIGKTEYKKYLTQTDNMNEMSDIVAEAIIETYMDNNICDAVDRGCEIIFKCKNYYLVNDTWINNNGIKI